MKHRNVVKSLALRSPYNRAGSPRYLSRKDNLSQHLALRRSGQTGLELLMYVSFSLLVFSGFYLGILKKDINAANDGQALRAEDISERIAFEIRTAKSVGDGYARNFTLTNDIYGSSYSVRLGNNTVLVDVGDKTFASFAPTSKVSGVVTGGCNTITNSGGNVSIKSC